MKLFIFSTVKLPPEVELKFQSLIQSEIPDLLVRTSGSKGIDSLIPSTQVKHEVYIPWEGFNEYSTENPNVICPKVKKPVIDILEEYILGELKYKYVKIDNRLVCGILGEDLNDPVDLVIINNIDSNILPTTSSALVDRIAFGNGIRVLNLEYSEVDDLESIIKDY